MTQQAPQQQPPSGDESPLPPDVTPAQMAARSAAIDVTTEFALASPQAQGAIQVLHPSDTRWALALQPTSPRDAMILATVLYKSGMFQRFGSREAIFAVVQMGRERGISALLSLQAMHVIEGKVELSADLIAALVLQSGKAKRFALVESTDELAVYEAQRLDDENPLRVSFSKKDAERRGLWGKSNWAKMPDVMLAHRCCSKAARLKFPEVTVGIYGYGEIREIVEAAVELTQGAT